MIQNAETKLWALASDLRSQLTGWEYVSIMSQLAVLAALARKDSQFKSTVTLAVDSGDMLVGALLDRSEAALDRLGIEKSHQLVDAASAGWKALSADWLLQALRVLLEDQRTPEEVGRWLVSHAAEKTRSFLSVPPELSRLFGELSRDAESIYLPFDEAALSVLETTNDAQQVTVRARSINALQFVARVLFVADRHASFQSKDPISSDGMPPEALTILMPPFGGKLDRMQILELPEQFQGMSRMTADEAALASLAANSDQMVLALVPSGLLFRGGHSRELREWLVEEIGVVTVIEFPPRVLLNTSIGCAVLVIHKAGSLLIDKVRFVTVDESTYLEEYKNGRFRVSGWKELAKVAWTPEEKQHEFVQHVDKAALRSNDYVLNPARYNRAGIEELLGSDHVTRLSNLCEIIRPMSVKDSDETSSEIFHEVTMRDFNRDGTVDHGSRERSIDRSSLSKIRRQRLQPGDILIGVKGTIGKVALVVDNADENLLAGQTTVILRLQDREQITDPAYLLRYLAQPAVGEFLESLSGGSAISFIRAKDLANLPVPVKPISKQAVVREKHDEIVAAVAESNRLREYANKLNREAFN